MSTPSIAVATALWGVPVISGGPYRGARRRVIAAVKDGGVRTSTAALVSPAMLGELARLRRRHPRMVLVPVPPSARGFFLRGFWPTVLIACALSAGVGGAPVARALSLGSLAVRDIVAGAGHTPRARAARLRRRWTRIRVRAMPANSQIVLVDDVMVTGATLEACARALRRHGHTTVGAFVVAHVPELKRSPFPRSGDGVYAEGTTLTRRT